MQELSRKQRRVFALLLFAFAACSGTPRVETPRVETPRVETPRVETPRRVIRHTDAFERRGFSGAAALILPSGEEHCFGDCEHRTGPASTFKVPHALIALDAGVLEGPDDLFEWDGEQRQLSRWNQDHTLHTAIRDSVVWYFQRLAPRIGRARFEESLRRFEYGNGRVGSDVANFWLDDSLLISPMEQARFWRRLHAGELGVTERSRSQVLEMTIVAQDEGAVLRGKTGWHVSAPLKI